MGKYILGTNTNIVASMERRTGLAVAVGISIILLFIIVIGGLVITGGPPTDEEGPGPQTPTPNTTETPTPTNNSSDSYKGVKLPNGVTTEGFANIEAFVSQHESYFNSRSYTLAYRSVRETQDGSLVLSETARVDKSGNFLIITNAPASRNLAYANQNTVFKSHGAVDTSYVVTQRSEHTVSPSRKVNLRDLLGAGQFRPTSLVERNNQTFVKMTTSSPTNSTDKVLLGNGVSDFQATVVISPDGYMKAFGVEYTTKIDGQKTTVGYNGAYESIGSTTVDKPEWLDLARQQHAKTEVYRESGYTSLVHKGGQTIPAGANVEVKVGNKTYSTQISDEFEQTDVLYFYLQNGELQVSSSQPSQGQGLSTSGDLVITMEANGKDWLIVQRLEE